MEDQEMKELEMVIQEKKDQESQEQEMEVPSTRSYNLLIVLLIVLLGVTVFVKVLPEILVLVVIHTVGTTEDFLYAALHIFRICSFPI